MKAKLLMLLLTTLDSKSRVILKKDANCNYTNARGYVGLISVLR